MNATHQAGHFHAVKFYDSPTSLCRIVAEFLGEGFIGRQPALVIATPEHRTGILTELRLRHFNVDQLQATGDLLLPDAQEMLSTFMVDGMPDAELFTTSATLALDQLCRGRKNCTIRAYGEMVDVLWKAGQQVAAIRLEVLWNKLAMTHDFELLCGYAMGNFYKDAQQDAHLAEIHLQHSHVIGGDTGNTERGATIN